MSNKYDKILGKLREKDEAVAEGGAVTSVNGLGGAVVLTQDTVFDGTTYKQYSATEKTKLAGITTGATANSTDATLLARANHTGTQAISTILSLQGTLDSKAPASHTHTASQVTDFDTEVSNNTDVAANTSARHTHANTTALNLVSGTNTGDNATNSQYSGLATSKQDTLVSGTNIKTINGTTLLGSGDITISGGGGAVDSVNTKTGVVVLTQDDIGDGTTYKQYSSTEKTKLSGIAENANNYTHPATHSADTITDGTTNKAYTATEQTKLAGIATGAEVNVQSDWTQATNTADDYIKNKPTIGTAAAKNIPATGDASVTEVVYGTDTRLTNARTPVAHTHTAANVTDFDTEVSNNTDVAANTSARHTHSNKSTLDNITAAYTTTEASKLSGIAAGAEVNVNADWNAASGDAQILNKPTLGTAAAKNIPATGNASATEVVYGTDTRLTDARAPVTHAHAIGDITATGTPSSTTFLRGDGTWNTPTDTTYSEISEAEITAGTASTARAITGRRAQAIVDKSQANLSPAIQLNAGKTAVGINKVPANGDLDVAGDIYSNGVKVQKELVFKTASKTFATGNMLAWGNVFYYDNTFDSWSGGNFTTLLGWSVHCNNNQFTINALDPTATNPGGFRLLKPTVGGQSGTITLYAWGY